MYNIIIFFALVITIISSNYISHLIGSNFYKEIPTSYKIHDLLHDILPDINKYHYIIDIIAFIIIIPAFIYFNSDLSIEFLTKFLIIMLIRSFTIISTVLPKYERCDETFTLRSFFLGGCYDKIFSGHTSFTLLLTLMYYREDIINLPTLYVTNILNMLLIIATRSHYTIDVLIAFFVTLTIFNIKI
jgi:hypothetical protein